MSLAILILLVENEILIPLVLARVAATSRAIGNRAAAPLHQWWQDYLEWLSIEFILNIPEGWEDSD